MSETNTPAPARKPWWRSSTLHIVIGLALGVLLGGAFPEDAHPFAHSLFAFASNAFLALIKGLVVPLILSTMVVGIAQTGEIRAIGRLGGKALLYFEVVTTLALFIGLAIGNGIAPGEGLPLDLNATAASVHPEHPQDGWQLAMHLFPSNLAAHWAAGDLLPIVVFAVLFGISLTRIGPRGKNVLELCESIAQVMFKYTDMVMRLTPIGVLGAMAASVSHMAAGQEIDGHVVSGWPAVLYLLGRYARLVGSLYLALVLLLLLVFVPIMLIVRVRPLAFLRAIREPALTAFTTASSEAALPRLLEDVVAFGVPRRIASFVIPAGYSFNLDGSTLYLVLASLTIAQAAHHPMPLADQIMMVVTFMLTSKGVAGVPRATLVIILGTIGSFGLPAEAGVAMLLAVDSLMDMARTTINVIGNGLASVVIARWEGVLHTEAPEMPAPETSP